MRRLPKSRATARTAYYTPRNDMNKRELMNLVNATGMSTGLMTVRDRVEFGASYRESQKSGKGPRKVVIEKAFDSGLDRQVGMIIAGSAGQKVKSTATLLARADMLSCLDATQKDDYPITVMTGHSVSEVNLLPHPIEYTAIDTPDYFAVISEDGLKKMRKWIARLPDSCVLYVDEFVTSSPVDRAAVGCGLEDASPRGLAFSSHR